eukprot:s3265_g9.t1
MFVAFAIFLTLILILAKHDNLLLTAEQVVDFDLVNQSVSYHGKRFTAASSTTISGPCTLFVASAPFWHSCASSIATAEFASHLELSSFQRLTVPGSYCHGNPRDGDHQTALAVLAMPSALQAFDVYVPAMPVTASYPMQQPSYAQNWQQDQSTWGQQWSRPRAKSRTHTPRGRRHRSASRNQDGAGNGPPQAPMIPQLSQGKGSTGAPPPPLPPPAVPWNGFGPAVPMMMMPPPAQTLQPMPISAPLQMNQFPQHSVPMGAAGLPQAPVAPPLSTPVVSQLDAEQKEFMEMARARQSELVADMRQKMQKITKKEGARATKDFHSAVRSHGFARSELEEALQARSNLISEWRAFIQNAVRTWQEYAGLFQQQEINLQKRIQEAQEKFDTAKRQVDESRIEAGKITIEIKDDDEEAPKEGLHVQKASDRIRESLEHLTTSLQTLDEQAAKIEVVETAAKRARTVSPQPSEVATWTAETSLLLRQNGLLPSPAGHDFYV